MRHISKEMLILIGLLGLSCLYVMVVNITDGGIVETDIIRSFAAYLNILLISQVLLLLSKNRIEFVCLISRRIFWGLLALGIIQTLGSDLLGSLIKLLVPRGEGSSLVESNRGVTLLATEPARAGIELTLIYLIYRLSKGMDTSNIYTDLLVILFQALIIKSASSLAFTLGAFTIIYLNFKFDLVKALVTVLFAGILIYFVSSILPATGGRAGDLVLHIIENDLNTEVLFFVANESGNRLLALYSFFISGVTNPLGHGIGAWPVSSMLAIQESGLDYRDFRFFDVVAGGNLVPFRGPGVISNLFLDVGVIGTLVILFVFKHMLSKYRSFNEISIKAFWIFMFKILLFGSPGNPVVFIFFISVFLLSKERIKN